MRLSLAVRVRHAVGMSSPRVPTSGRSDVTVERAPRYGHGAWQVVVDGQVFGYVTETVRRRRRSPFDLERDLLQGRVPELYRTDVGWDAHRLAPAGRQLIAEGLRDRREAVLAVLRGR